MGDATGRSAESTTNVALPRLFLAGVFVATGHPLPTPAHDIHESGAPT